MAITISFGLQKGGVGKTTSVALTSYVLSKRGYKVLAVDMDPQGNLSQFLSRKPLKFFENKTVFEAIKEEDPLPYIHEISEELHLLPADDLLFSFSVYLMEEHKGSANRALANTLDKVYDDYDFILIDLPPHLGEETINGITASNYVVAVMQTEPMAYDALRRFIETVNEIKEQTRNDLVLLGILPTLTDTRVVLADETIKKAKQKYGDLVFNTVIRRRNRLAEFSIMGITEKDRQDIDAIEHYIYFTRELLKRVSQAENDRRLVESYGG